RPELRRHSNRPRGNQQGRRAGDSKTDQEWPVAQRHEHVRRKADGEPDDRRLAHCAEQPEYQDAGETSRDVGGVGAQRRQLAKFLADECTERNEEQRDEREEHRDDDGQWNRVRRTDVAEDAPQELALVVRYRDAHAAEDEDGTEEKNGRGHGEPIELAREIRAQQPDAHSEERPDQDEVLIESEYTHVCGRVSNEGELEEEHERRVGGEPE